MEGDLGRKATSQVRDAKLVDQERGKLKRPPGQLDGSFRFGRILKEFRVEVSDHGATRSGGNHYRVLAAEGFQYAPGDAPGFVPVARIECRLAATNDRFFKIDRVPELFENAHRADAH